MSPKKEKLQTNKVEEPASVYDHSNLKQKGIDRATFDFDKEFEKGLTPEEFKAEMSKRIKGYPWKK